MVEIKGKYLRMNGQNADPATDQPLCLFTGPTGGIMTTVAQIYPELLRCALPERWIGHVQNTFEVSYFWLGKTYSKSLMIRVIKRPRITGFTKTVLHPYIDSVLVHFETGSLDSELSYECFFLSNTS